MLRRWYDSQACHKKQLNNISGYQRPCSKMTCTLMPAHRDPPSITPIATLFAKHHNALRHQPRSTLDHPRPAREPLARHPSQQPRKLRVRVQWLYDLIDLGVRNVALLVVARRYRLGLRQQDSGQRLARDSWRAAHCIPAQSVYDATRGGIHYLQEASRVTR